MECGDVRAERDQVRKLYQALTEAKKKSGEAVSGNLDSFSSFVQKKTEQIRKQYGCEAVEYTVEMQNGQVKLKAKAKSLVVGRQSFGRRPQVDSSCSAVRLSVTLDVAWHSTNATAIAPNCNRVLPEA